MGFNALRFKALKKHFQGSCTCALFTMSDGNSVVKRLKVPPPSPKNIRPGTVGSVCRPSTNLLAAPSQRASFAETGRLWAPHHAAAALPIWPPVPSERGFKCPFLCLHATAELLSCRPPAPPYMGVCHRSTAAVTVVLLGSGPVTWGSGQPETPTHGLLPVNNGQEGMCMVHVPTGKYLKHRLCSAE